ncbi:MAG: DNA-processing protein DprA [Candidatus Levybacteria bacterium]|nr:DNA-processing protein DprA [Candidatus Levybacteria bacterium]MBP9815008.1 DNA-processing protein DprA [Candidatus Levybacteria bacterium]
MSESQAAFAISLCDGIGPKTFYKLIKYFGSADKIWENLNSFNYKNVGMGKSVFQKFESHKNSFDLPFYLNKLEKAKVVVVAITDVSYPDSLKKLEAPPIVLYCKGNLDLLNTASALGVVGARKITSYGKEVTQKIVSELVAQDIVIVSGLAFGVDAVSHVTTLSEMGKTIAVLGCGVDCCTPLENQGVYEEILDKEGLILSEYFLGQPPSVGSFPARNRIIAGLARGVLVTEAAEDSGSLITAEESVKLGRPVFAVPGPITSHMSKGTLKLLKQQAKLVSSSDDILEVLKIKGQNSNLPAGKAGVKIASQKLKLNAEERRVVRLLESEPMTLDQISKNLKIPMVKLMVLVSGLEMRGTLINTGSKINLII